MFDLIVLVVLEIASGTLRRAFVSVSFSINLYLFNLLVVSCFEVVSNVMAIGKLYRFFFFGRLVGVRLMVIFFVGYLYSLLIMALRTRSRVFFIVVFGKFIIVKSGRFLLICILIVIGGVFIFRVARV